MSEVRQEFLDRLQAESGATLEATPETTEEPVEAGDPEVVEEHVDGEVDDTVAAEGSLDPEAEADEGDPVDGEQPTVDPEYQALEDKYKSLEQEFSRVTANRRQIEQSLDEAKSKSVQAMHALEDKYKEAEQVAEYFAGMANQHLQQLNQVNPAQLTQEQFTQYQQSLLQAQQNAQQQTQLIEAIRKERTETTKQMKEREAEIARERLKTRIPDWSSDMYRSLGELAQEYGYSAEEFFESTDYRMVLMLNDVAKSREAANVVTESVKKTKQSPPRHRAARAQERNAKGQFTSAQKDFMETRPGTKGSFAAMKAAQLRAERESR